jgi:hypothetical protein
MTKKKETKKVVKPLKKLKIVSTEVIDFGDMKIEETTYSDGSTAAKRV